MFSKFSQVLTVLPWSRWLSGTLATLGLLAGTASAGTIYQDSLNGSTTLGTLNTATPTVDTNNATWTASSTSSYGWADSGNVDAQAFTGAGQQSAYLPFTPVTGQIYTLSAGLDVLGNGGQAGLPAAWCWVALGFTTAEPTTSNNWDAAGGVASPWVQNGYQANNDYAFTGPGIVGQTAFSVGTTSGVNTYSIVLNTGSPAYSYQEYLTNSANTNTLVGSGTFTTNPAITAVGLEMGAGAGQASNFSLTDVAVPEPAQLWLVGIGGALGLLLLKRHRTGG